MRGFRQFARRGARHRVAALAAGLALGTALLAAPAAQAGVINNPMKNTCQMFTDPPGGPQVTTDGTIQTTITVQAVAEAPDAVHQGASVRFTGMKLGLGLSTAAVGVLKSFGKYVAGEVTDLSLVVAGGAPAAYNVAADQPGGAIPFTQQAIVVGTPLAFDAPASGSLAPIGPVTVIGPVASDLALEFTRFTAKFRMSDTPDGPTFSYEYRCTPNLRPGETTTLARILIASGQRVPSVSSLAPNAGLVSGGDVVRINGANLDLVVGVLFGSAEVPFTRSPDGTLSFVTPAHFQDYVPVRLRSRLGDVSPYTPDTSDIFTYLPPPVSVVTSVSPASGPVAGGNTVTVRGVFASSFGEVRFGGVLGTDPKWVSPTELTVKAPAGAAGKVDVRVTTPGAGVSVDTPADDYTYLAPAPLPKISRLSPNTGLARVGGLTTIQGTGLKGVKSVKFGSKATKSFFVLGSSLVVVAPPLPPGTYPVTVTTAAGSSLASAAARYTYIGL